MGFETFAADMDEIKRLPGIKAWCPKCKGQVTARKDHSHGNTFCQNCGLLISQRYAVVHNWNYVEFWVDIHIPEHKRRRKYKRKDINHLRRKHEKKTSSKRDYEINVQYKRFLDTLKSLFQMNDFQRKEVFWYIEKGGLKVFCKNCSMEQIILGLTVYVLRADNPERVIKFEDFSIFQDVELDLKNYTRIAENIGKFERKMRIEIMEGK